MRKLTTLAIIPLLLGGFLLAFWASSGSGSLGYCKRHPSWQGCSTSTTASTTTTTTVARTVSIDASQYPTLRAVTSFVATTFQWRQCDQNGANCTDVSGATSASYVVPAGFNGTLRVVADGVTSAPWSIAPISASVPFSPNSVINIPIPASPPIHADSNAMIQANPNWLLGATNANREWIGPRQRTAYFKIIRSSTPTGDMYVNFVDFQGYACATTPRVVPIPTAMAALFGTTSASFDRNLWMADENGNAWEGYRVTAPGVASMDTSCTSSRWNAVRFDSWPGEEATGLGYGHGLGGSGSKIQMGAGLIRPEEMALPAGSNLGHVIKLDGFVGANGGTSGHPRFVFPAGSGDGQQTGTKGIPMGARLQLDPSIDVETWPSVNAKAEPWREGLKKILRTMQIYGVMPVDSTSAPGAGGIESVYQQSYSLPWIDAGYGWGIANGIPYDLMSHFRVIDWNLWDGR